MRGRTIRKRLGDGLQQVTRKLDFSKLDRGQSVLRQSGEFGEFGLGEPHGFTVLPQASFSELHK